MTPDDALAVAEQIANGMSEVGVSLTYVVDDPGTYSPTAGQVGGGDQRVPIIAVPTVASKGAIEAFDIRLNDGVRESYRALQVAAFGLPVVPQPGAKIEGLEGTAWSVLGVTPESLCGVALVYKMTVKRT